MDDKELKAQLINQLKSQNDAEALKAVEQLREKGWLTDRTLFKADLRGANLVGADLRRCAIRFCSDVQRKAKKCQPEKSRIDARQNDMCRPA